MERDKWWLCRDWYPREQRQVEIHISMWSKKPERCQWTDSGEHTEWCGWYQLSGLDALVEGEQP